MYHPFNLEYCCYYSSSTVRQRAIVVFKGKYKTVDDADADHGLTIESYLGLNTDQNVDPQLAHTPSHLLSSISHLGESQLKVVITKAFEKVVEKKTLLIELATKTHLAKLFGSITEEVYKYLPEVKKDLLLNALSLQHAIDHGIDSDPGDFTTLSMKSMVTLQENGKPNLVYKWC